MIGHSEEIDDLYYRERPRGIALEDGVRRRIGRTEHPEHPVKETLPLWDLTPAQWTGNGPVLDHCRTGTERKSKQKRRNHEVFGALSAPWGSTDYPVFCKELAF